MTTLAKMNNEIQKRVKGMDLEKQNVVPGKRDKSEDNAEKVPVCQCLGYVCDLLLHVIRTPLSIVLASPI